MLRRLQSHILQKQEDWLGAARALMAIPLEGNTRRCVRKPSPDAMRSLLTHQNGVGQGEAWGLHRDRPALAGGEHPPAVVSCACSANLVQCGESGQAQTYFSRASLLIHTTTDPVTKLHYRLSQVSLGPIPLLRGAE